MAFFLPARIKGALPGAELKCETRNHFKLSSLVFRVPPHTVESVIFVLKLAQRPPGTVGGAAHPEALQPRRGGSVCIHHISIDSLFSTLHLSLPFFRPVCSSLLDSCFILHLFVLSISLFLGLSWSPSFSHSFSHPLGRGVLGLVPIPTTSSSNRTGGHGKLTV